MSSDLRPKGATGSPSGTERAGSSNTGRSRPPSSSSLGRPPETKAAQGQTTLPIKLTPGEFNTAIVHLYRGEVQRSNTWRNRLDTTTNWAVLTAGATLSFVFSSPSNPHFVIPINSILVVIFLLMEARRYRYYEIWSSRVRMVETGYFAQLLAPENRPTDDAWAEH